MQPLQIICCIVFGTIYPYTFQQFTTLKCLSSGDHIKYVLQKIFIFSYSSPLFHHWTSLSYAAEMKAMDLIHIQGCKGCHSLDGRGGTLGPVLDGVGSRLTWEQLKQKLVNPKNNKPTSVMPDYRHLSTSELQQLTDYLAHLR